MPTQKPVFTWHPRSYEELQALAQLHAQLCLSGLAPNDLDWDNTKPIKFFVSPHILISIAPYMEKFLPMFVPHIDTAPSPVSYFP